MISGVGELASLGAALIWSCSMSLFAVQGRGLPAEGLNLFKNAIAFVGFGLACLALQPAWPTELRTVSILAASGVIGITLGDTALFAALSRLGAQVTSASQCLAPPIAAIAAAWSMGETLSPLETAGLVVTVTAVFGVIHFGRREGASLAGIPRRTLLVGIAYAALAATCQGIGLVMSRYAFQNVDVLSGTIIRIAPALVLLVGLTLSGPARRTLKTLSIPRRRLGLLALASFAGTFIGLLLMSIGAKYAKAGVTAALTSTYPIWIIPIAHFVVKERVNWHTVACTVVAVAGIAMLFLG